MSTVQEAIDRRGGPWVLWVEIAGLGAAGGPYRFCTSPPAFAAGDDTWKPILRELPTEIPQDVDALGGVERAGVLTFTLVDREDFLTDLFRFDAPPIGELLQVLDRTTTQFIVRNGAFAAVDRVIYLDQEAMVITAVDAAGAPGQITVTRGALGTLATDHRIQTPIRGWVPKLHGREVTLHMAPYDADDISERLDLGDFVVRKVDHASGFTGWTLGCGSQILGLKRRIGEALQGHYRVTHLFGDRAMSLERVLTSRTLFSLDVWSGDAGKAYFLLNGTEYLIGRVTGTGGVGGQLIDQVIIERRGALGTQPLDLPGGVAGDGVRLQRPLVADTIDGLGAFRYIPTTAADQEDRADAAVVQSDHFVDIALCLLASSRRVEDELELTNYTAGKPNYSTLPVGFGAGIRADRIDWDEWLSLKARTPNWRFPGFVLKEPGQLGDIVTKHFLRPLGLFLVTHLGKLRPVLPRLPFEGQAATAIGVSEILAPPQPARPALLTGGYDVSVQKKAVLLKPRDASGTEVKILLTTGDFGGELGDDDETGPEDVLEIDLPGVRTNQGGVTAFFEELAARRLYRLARPPPAFEVNVSLALKDLALGELGELSFPALPDPKTGVRGLAANMTVIAKALDLDLQNPGFKLRLLGYGGSVAVGLIAPAAVVSAYTDGTNTVTCEANRFTSPDGDLLELPTTEAEQFKAGMLVKLIDFDGTDAHVSTQVVQADGAGGAVVLDAGKFGIADPTDLIMVLADYAAARTEDQDTFVAFADRTNRTVGASSREPWSHGEQ